MLAKTIMAITHYFGVADQLIGLQEILKELELEKEYKQISKMEEIFKQMNLGHVL